MSMISEGKEGLPRRSSMSVRPCSFFAGSSGSVALIDDVVGLEDDVCQFPGTFWKEKILAFLGSFVGSISVDECLHDANLQL